VATVFGIPVALLLFAATLALVVLFHRRARAIALAGLAVIIVVRLFEPGFSLVRHLVHEGSNLANLLGLLVGFAVVADHFERSHLPERLPRLLPAGAPGCFGLLLLIWLLSGVLDNIAAALIGATAATQMFKGRVHLGYLTAIVACANAGGAGSVIGDTTTTMIWIEGIRPSAVLPAYLGAGTALLVVGIPAARRQARHAPIEAPAVDGVPIDVRRVAIVLAALIAIVTTNAVASARLGAHAEDLPLLAGALWLVLGLGCLVRRPDGAVIRRAAGGAVFLLALVLAASLMPVDALPAPGWATTLGLGFLSAIFDNIPLTKLALAQGGYDWALLAYAIGFGGSMVWFGSSAGVAVADLHPEARSAAGWLRAGWFVPLGFVAGYFVQLAVTGWNP
jgi:Na+/H+ antiporter NhaD/arsenite permease-like protein